MDKDSADVRVEQRDRSWINWRGAVEGYEPSVGIVARAIEEHRTDGGLSSREIAEHVLWLIGLDHVWKHVEALRDLLATPSPAPAINEESLGRAIMAEVFYLAQPDRGDVFSWLDDHISQIVAAALRANGCAE